MKEPLFSKPLQIAQLITTRIQEGEWTAALPPERVLAEEYLVSRTSIRSALDILEEKKIISPPKGTRSPRTINRRKSLPSKKIGQALLLTSYLHESPQLLTQVALLRDLLSRNNIQLDTLESNQLARQKNPLRLFKKIATDHPHAVWILHRLPESVQHAAKKLNLSTLIFGSAFPHIPFPFVDLDFAAVARHATNLCLRRNLSRLALIVHRTSLAGDAAIMEALRSELQKNDAPPPLILNHDFNRSRLIDSLDQTVIHPSSCPQALLIVNQHHVLTTIPHLLRRGLCIPDDISVLFLGNDPAVERLSPVPDRYHIGDKLVRKLALSVRTRLNGEIPKSTLLLPERISGETLTKKLP
jgi:DNA-binding LacI/PurR family transcriptional regulator